MKARPILMSASMVRALLEGRKTQTRRIVKHHCYIGNPIAQPHILDFRLTDRRGKWVGAWDLRAQSGNAPCPYGKPGDLLWVRESIERAKDWGGIGYPADGRWFPDSAWVWKRNTLPSIHMPRGLSRLTLELTSVRVERLQDINEVDAQSEGCVIGKVTGHAFDSIAGLRLGGPEWANARDWYADLWESINGPGSWTANPWVWVLEFRVHQRNVDTFLQSKEAA